MDKTITEFQTLDGEILGRLWKDPNEKVWKFADMDLEEAIVYDVKCFSRYEDQILINCYNGTTFWF